MQSRVWTVGVDFGGTNVKCGVVGRDGRVVARRSLATASVLRPAAFVQRVADEIAGLLGERGITSARLAGVGIGAPGSVDSARGIVHATVNVPGWREVPLARLMARRLHCPVRVDNDANGFTVGEWRVGAGQGTRHMVGLTLGTGVGGGLIVEGRLARGVTGAAGEVGHMSLDPRGPRCGCGRRGCLEAYVGTAAILRRARRALRAQPGGALARLAREARGQLTPELLSAAARTGDGAARAVWRETGWWLGVGLANLVNLLSPERIVIGGGVARAWRWFAPAMEDAWRAQAMAEPRRACRVVRAALGDDAGIIGAASLVVDTDRRTV